MGGTHSSTDYDKEIDVLTKRVNALQRQGERIDVLETKASSSTVQHGELSCYKLRVEQLPPPVESKVNELFLPRNWNEMTVCGTENVIKEFKTLAGQIQQKVFTKIGPIGSAQAVQEKEYPLHHCTVLEKNEDKIAVCHEHTLMREVGVLGLSLGTTKEMPSIIEKILP